MRAEITLKEGKSYRWKGYVFTAGSVSTVTNPQDIDYLRTVGILGVNIIQDAPVKATKPAKPATAPQPAVDEGTEEAGEPSEPSEEQPEEAAEDKPKKGGGKAKK